MNKGISGGHRSDSQLSYYVQKSNRNMLLRIDVAPTAEIIPDTSQGQPHAHY